jgi:hypothetical protein
MGTKPQERYALLEAELARGAVRVKDRVLAVELDGGGVLVTSVVVLALLKECVAFGFEPVRGGHGEVPEETGGGGGGDWKR